MNVKECYDLVRGDYEDVRRRFISDNRITRFALLFLKDDSMDGLRKAMEEENCELAFQAAHTLKGVCLNLGLTGLSEPVSSVTELLRSGDLENARREMLWLERVYTETYEGLKALERS